MVITINLCTKFKRSCITSLSGYTDRLMISSDVRRDNKKKNKLENVTISLALHCNLRPPVPKWMKWN